MVVPRRSDEFEGILIFHFGEVGMAIGKEVDGQFAQAWGGCGGGKGRVHVRIFILERNRNIAIDSEIMGG